MFPRRQHGRGGWERRQYLPNLHTHMARGRPIQNIKFREKLKNKSLPVMRVEGISPNPDEGIGVNLKEDQWQRNGQLHQLAKDMYYRARPWDQTLVQE